MLMTAIHEVVVILWLSCIATNQIECIGKECGYNVKCRMYQVCNGDLLYAYI
jgi:hypothetical protein